MTPLFIIEIVVCSLIILGCLAIIWIANFALKRKKANLTNVSDKDSNSLVAGIKFCMIAMLIFGFFLAVAICSLILL